MKNRKWIGIIGIIILLIALGAFGIFNLTQNIKKDKETTKQNIENVIKYYSEFNDLALSFNEKSQNLTVQMNEVYFTNLKEESESLQNVLNGLEEIINNMNIISKELDHLCKATYLDSTVNRNCSSYQVSFDSAESVFEGVIRKYNDLVTQYNDWTKDNPEYEEVAFYKRNLVVYEE